MKDPNLFLVKRHFEILLEAFQGLEGLASHSDCDSTSVGKAMVPIIFQAEDLLADIVTLYEKGKLEKGVISSEAKLVVLNFPEARMFNSAFFRKARMFNSVVSREVPGNFR